MTDKVGKILAFIEERIKWNEDMMKRDPKPSDIGRIEEAKCIRRFIDSIQEEPKMCMYTKDDFTDEDRKTFCEGCEEDCEYNKIEEPVSIWHDSNKEQPEYGSDVIVLQGYEGDVLHRVVKVNPDRIWAYTNDILSATLQDD